MTAENALAIAGDVDLLRSNSRLESAAILQALAEEEAAKVLMLLDIARSNWGDQKEFHSFGKFFYSHLARGIYVAVYETKPADQDEQRKYADLLRRNRYLDGPLGFEWIFGNSITTKREQIIYVDYVEDPEGKSDWISPQGRYGSATESISYGGDNSSVIVSLVHAMEKIGMLTEENLEIIRETHSTTRITEDSHWQELRQANATFISKLCLDEGLKPFGEYVVEKWIFPMFSFDLNPIESNEQSLRREQELRSASEFGYGEH